MFDELQNAWQNITPDTQAAIQYASVVLVALVGGHFLGGMVARGLRAKNFDAVLRLPGAPPRSDADTGITPTLVAGLLVRLTVWTVAAWWLAHTHGRDDLANTLALIINRTWGFAAVLVAALALGSLLARRLIDCLHGLPKEGEARPSRNGAVPSPWNAAGAAGAVGAGAYVLIVLLVLLTAADLFDWPLTRTSALALWQFAQRLAIAGAGLFIGHLGARWTRDLTSSEGGASAEKRAGQYTALGIMAATTVLAVTVVLSNAGVLLGLAALAVLGFLLWMARGYLPDVTAGLQLRSHTVHEVLFDGDRWQVAAVGFLTTQLSRAGAFCRIQNRLVLEARLHGAMTEAAPG
jgi:hypothetical protein